MVDRLRRAVITCNECPCKNLNKWHMVSYMWCGSKSDQWGRKSDQWLIYIEFNNSLSTRQIRNLFSSLTIHIEKLVKSPKETVSELKAQCSNYVEEGTMKNIANRKPAIRKPVKHKCPFIDDEAVEYPPTKEARTE